MKMKRQTRREFLRASSVVLAGLMPGPALASRASEARRPNIIYIYTDQQSASMMSCAGNEWLKTPAMDYIAANGIRFTLWLHTTALQSNRIGIFAA